MSKIRYKTILFVIIMKSILISRAESDLKFCDVNNFDGVYNFGPNIYVQHKDYVWKVDNRYGMDNIVDPPIKKSLLMNSSRENLLTSMYFSEVPECTPHDELIEGKCNNYKYAQYLVPFRIRNSGDNKEYSGVFRMAPNGDLLERGQLPWDFNLSFDIWPLEWKYDSTARPSAYSPLTYEVFFIVNSGHKEMSTLHYNSIRNSGWTATMIRQPLNSSIHFVGMFHLKHHIYAIGDHSHLAIGDDKSVLYKLIRKTLPNSNNQYFYYDFQANDISLKKFFGCKVTETVPPIIDTNRQTTKAKSTHSSEEHEEHDSEQENDSEDNNSGFAIKMIIALLVLLIIATIAIVLIYFIIKKVKKKKTHEKDSSRKSTFSHMFSHNNDEKDSIATIDSTDGTKVND